MLYPEDGELKIEVYVSFFEVHCLLCCSDGFFFAVKEVSLLDQGDEGKQRIMQLEQV